MGAVHVQALGLSIGTALAAGVGALVPVQAQPAEILDRRPLGFPCRPREISVLDPEDERAACAARHQPIEERRAGIADVKLAGGTGRESETHEMISVTQRHTVRDSSYELHAKEQGYCVHGD